MTDLARELREIAALLNNRDYSPLLLAAADALENAAGEKAIMRDQLQSQALRVKELEAERDGISRELTEWKENHVWASYEPTARLAAAQRDIKTFGDPALLAAQLVLAERVVDAARARCERMKPHHDDICIALYVYDAAELRALRTERTFGKPHGKSTSQGRGFRRTLIAMKGWC